MRMPTVVSVPGHSDIAGNYEADNLARNRTIVATVNFANDAGIPFSSVKYLLRSVFTNKENSRWEGETACNLTRQIWTVLDKEER